MEEVLRRVKRIHLIGIGGIGMSGLAFLLKEKGFEVSGSDVASSYVIDKLKEAGIEVQLNHHEDNVKMADLVCFSSAIKEDNPEIAYAKNKDITLMHRSELLAVISSKRKTIAVTGSHGKTTTTSLLGFVLSSLGYNPAVFVGGIPLNYDTHAWWGHEYFVIEADESDGSFLQYEPKVSIITNIDYEHMDHYKNMDVLKNSFLQFAEKTHEMVIGCGDDPALLNILEKVPSITYGLEGHNRVRAENIKFCDGFMIFDLIVDGKRTQVKTALIGEHNVLNTLAVIAFLLYKQENLEVAIETMKEFKGVKRRLQTKANIAGITFMEDYAHHPTEIKAILKAVRLLGSKRIVAVFQPHRFSRIKLLYDEFARCLDIADVVIVTDIYAASEKEIEGISGKFLYEKIKQNPKIEAHFIPRNELIEGIRNYIREGDLVLGLGAGDINTVIDRVADEFRKDQVKA